MNQADSITPGPFPIERDQRLKESRLLTRISDLEFEARRQGQIMSDLRESRHLWRVTSIVLVGLFLVLEIWK